MKKAIFYLRIKELAAISNKSLNQVERELHYPRNALSNYRTYNSPSGKRLLEIANYFNVSPQYLLGNSDSTQFTNIFSLFKSLNVEQKKEMSELCQKWLLENIEFSDDN